MHVGTGNTMSTNKKTNLGRPSTALSQWVDALRPLTAGDPGIIYAENGWSLGVFSARGGI